MPKTCSHINFLMFEHLLTPLFQHLGPFLSVKVDQDLNIETLKISKHQRVPPLKMRKIFVSDFTEILCVDIRISNFEYHQKKRKKIKFFKFLPNARGPSKFLKSNFSIFLKKKSKVALLDLGNFQNEQSHELL